MIEICPSCEALCRFTLENGVWTCRSCSHRRAFRQPPLVLIMGPSGSGKTFLLERLQRNYPWIVFDGDLWLPERGMTTHRWLQKWLTVCLEAGQCGQPVVLGGNFTPEAVLACSRLKGFSPVVPICLDTEEHTCARSCSRRPDYRKITKIRQHMDWSRYRRGKALPQVTLLVREDGEAMARRVARILDQAMQKGSQPE